MLQLWERVLAKTWPRKLDFYTATHTTRTHSLRTALARRQPDRYKDGVVKFVLAQFAQHFGAASGDGLRSWAAAHGWAVLWSWGVGNRPIMSMPDPWLANQRMVDPVALLRSRAGGNISAQATQAAPLWQSLWANASATRAATGTAGPSDAQLHGWWLQLQAEPEAQLLMVEPVRAAACESAHQCVGVDKQGQCVCY
jgi:hypothetical protein